MSSLSYCEHAVYTMLVLLPKQLVIIAHANVQRDMFTHRKDWVYTETLPTLISTFLCLRVQRGACRSALLFYFGVFFVLFFIFKI